MSETELIVVSHSAQFPGQTSAAGGGLIVTVDEPMRKRGGHWIALKGNPDPSRTRMQDGKIEFHAVAPKPGFIKVYDRLNNSTWPFANGLAVKDLDSIMSPDEPLLHDYNYAFARKTMSVIKEVEARGNTPLPFAQDYQEMGFAKALRNEGYKGPVGTFMHTPIPGPADFEKLPAGRPREPGPREKMKASYAELFYNSWVGTQTPDDKDNLVSLGKEFGWTPTSKGLRKGGRTVQIDVAPVSIDPSFYTKFDYTKPPSKKAKEVIEFTSGDAGGNAQRGNEASIGVLAVGRIDPIKGFLQAILEAGDLPKHSRLRIALVGAESRKGVKLNDDYRNETLQAYEASKVQNPGRVKFFDEIPRGELRPALRFAARIGLIPSPGKDGMNLVAKEWVMAQDPEDPGVLVIAKGVGAARQLTGAVVYDPDKKGDMARALNMAERMAPEERKRRHAVNRKAVVDSTTDQWFDKCVGFLKGLQGNTGQEPAPRLDPLAAFHQKVPTRRRAVTVATTPAT